eukprot:TRINITY_DN7165_c0_g1_i1.p1 TRINITY_DN7165_c0_g1~~TRINITY_DN7165_c0_g1_i1.p1  ORF type:complete len:457 (-),score=46.44 TRINITY_DN7165_c0_g1_i1:38-1408(-)
MYRAPSGPRRKARAGPPMITSANDALPPVVSHVHRPNPLPAHPRTEEVAPFAALAAGSEAEWLAAAQARRVRQWTAEDDRALVEALPIFGSIEAVHAAVAFSKRFTPADLAERWGLLLYDPSTAHTSTAQMQTVAPYEPPTQWSVVEEQLMWRLVVSDANEADSEKFAAKVQPYFAPCRTVEFLARVHTRVRGLVISAQVPAAPFEANDVYAVYGSDFPRLIADIVASPALAFEAMAAARAPRDRKVRARVNPAIPPPPPSRLSPEVSPAQVAQLFRKRVETVSLERSLHSNPDDRHLGVLSLILPSQSTAGVALSTEPPTRMANSAQAGAPAAAVRQPQSIVQLRMIKQRLTVGRGSVSDLDLHQHTGNCGVLRAAIGRISRSQFMIRLSSDSNFRLTNLGVRPVLVNGEAVLQKRSVVLSPPDTLIEVAGLTFLFSPNLHVQGLCFKKTDRMQT